MMDPDKSITKSGGNGGEESDRMYRELLIKEMMQKLQQKIEQNDPVLIKALKDMIMDDELPAKPKKG